MITLLGKYKHTNKKPGLNSKQNNFGEHSFYDYNNNNNV